VKYHIVTLSARGILFVIDISLVLKGRFGVDSVLPLSSGFVALKPWR
jgi:hypothetical protein